MRRAGHPLARRLLASAVLSAAIAAPAGASAPPRPGLEGTVWVGNRQWTLLRPEVVAYDAASGQEAHSVQLPAAASDLATGKGKVFVGDEANSRVWIIDGTTGQVSGFVATGSRPHHLASSRGGNLIAYGAFGTNRVGVIDARSGEVVGEWPASAKDTARVHAAAFSPDGRVVYTANDVTGEVGAVDIRSGERLWTEAVPRAHELIVSADGRRVYVSCRTDDKIRVLDPVERTVTDLLSLPRPDTLQLSANGKQLTVGLRDGPNLAVVDLESAAVTALIAIPGGTLAGHQWSSGNGRHTFVAHEGSPAGTAVIAHETNTVAQTLAYPGGGQPHGLAYLAPHGE
jgi:DNA-binding beta-propeller fold protein YncE